jgi:hypothetical protein
MLLFGKNYPKTGWHENRHFLPKIGANFRKW